jgi:tetratricopeptide (TPR) repeat protein
MWPFGRKQVSRVEHNEDTVTFHVRRGVVPYLQAGRSYCETQDYDRAIEEYENALKVDPNCALLHFNLGSTQLAVRDFSGAKRSFHRAVELDPHCSLFLEHLGRLYFETKEYAQSILYFQRASAAGEMHPVCYGIMGRAYLEREEYEKGIECLRKMLEREADPIHRTYAEYYLVLGCLGSGDLMTARDLADSLLDKDGVDPEVYRDLGEHFLDISCIGMAGELFARVLDLGEDPRAEEACVEICEIEEKIDRILPQVFCGDEEVVLQNIHLLQQFGSPKVSRALLSILDAASPLIREAVIEYNRVYGFPVHHQVLPLMHDEKDFVREKCAEFLAGVESEDVTRTMRGAIFDDSSKVKLLAARHLARSGRFDAVPEISEAMGAEWDDDVREAFRDTIARIKRRTARLDESSGFGRVIPIGKPFWVTGRFDAMGWLRPLLLVLLFGLLAALFFLLRPSGSL